MNARGGGGGSCVQVYRKTHKSLKMKLYMNACLVYNYYIIMEEQTLLNDENWEEWACISEVFNFIRFFLLDPDADVTYEADVREEDVSKSDVEGASGDEGDLEGRLYLYSWKKNSINENVHKILILKVFYFSRQDGSID